MKRQNKEKIDVKIVSKDEAFWTRVKEQSEREIETNYNSIKLNEVLLETAIRKINEEQNKQ